MTRIPYKRGEILREDTGEVYVVLEDEGTDKCGQILMAELGDPAYLTPKPNRWRRVKPKFQLADKPHYIIELQPGCWLAPWSGDPGRTLVRESARQFATRRGATVALRYARQHRPLRDAQVVEVQP